MQKNLYIIWSDNNKLGVPIIDEQHRGIISTINSLYYFIRIGRGEEILKTILTTLEQYAEIHFKTEEELMTQANYPAVDEHRVLHETLIEKTKRFSVEADRDTGLVLKFLREWWLGHINKEDRKYVPFMRNL